MRTHICGGTILTGGPAVSEQAHQYCDRCGAFTYDMDARTLPSGTNPSVNQEAWDDGAGESPEAVETAYPRDVAREVSARRPDLSANDAIAAVLTADPTLSASKVIEILDESAAE